mmetsp:Transcript_14596/g.32182  ORF Transcript_14596/g.32182 Transcript_14596/m.32182 type:complete len:214 (-) Transcript_14596:1288-1929(-)
MVLPPATRRPRRARTRSLHPPLRSQCPGADRRRRGRRAPELRARIHQGTAGPHAHLLSGTHRPLRGPHRHRISTPGALLHPTGRASIPSQDTCAYQALLLGAGGPAQPRLGAADARLRHAPLRSAADAALRPPDQKTVRPLREALEKNTAGAGVGTPPARLSGVVRYFCGAHRLRKVVSAAAPRISHSFFCSSTLPHILRKRRLGQLPGPGQT